MPCLQENENDTRKRARLVDSLSQSFPSSALSKALQMACNENVDPLSSSCFANIRLEKFNSKEEMDDDELTSLAWLQDANLLKNITPDDKCMSPVPKNELSSVATSAAVVPYDPLLHVKHKPPYSFSCLIFMAIEASPSKCLPVKGIYDWIVKTFPFFQTAPTGWRNSVRHNLSLNKCFKKTERDHRQGLGKGSSWCIDPLHRPNLLQALRRTPYHPFQQLQMVSNGSSPNQNDDEKSPGDETKRSLGQFLSPDFFPFLSKQLSQINDPCFDQKMRGVHNLLDNVSKSMNIRQSFPQQSVFSDCHAFRERIVKYLRSRSDLCDLVCTAYPTEDHEYSIPPSLLEDVQASLDNVSVDEGLDSVSLSTDDELAVEDLESESDTNVATNVEKVNAFKNNGSTETSYKINENNSEMRKTTEDSADEEEKTLYFTSLALLELAAGKPTISGGYEMKPKKMMMNEVKGQAPEISKKTVERRENSKRKGKKMSSLRKSQSDPATDSCSERSGRGIKRKQKQLLPINSSLWGKRRKLPDQDVPLEAKPRRASAGKVKTPTRKRTITRHRRKQ